MRAKIDLRKLPPLNALKGFEATSRRQSVRDAADELCLTHQAVSYQIQVLEEELGVALFSRSGRSLVPTPEGKLLYKYVRSALEMPLLRCAGWHNACRTTALRIPMFRCC